MKSTPVKKPQRKNSYFILGDGREVSSRTKLQRLVYTMPICGPLAEQKLWKVVPVSTEGADTPHLCAVAGTGKGKTEEGVTFALDALDQGSLVLFSGGGPLIYRFVQECVVHNISPEQVCLMDLTYQHKTLGTPLLDVVRPSLGFTHKETAEAFVTDLMLVSQLRSTPGARQNEAGYNIFRVLQTEAGGQPLSALIKFIYDVDTRKAWGARCPDEEVRLYWQHFEREYNANQKAVVLNPVINKLSPLLRSEFAGPMFTRIESTMDIRRIINTKGMCLACELSERRLGPDVAESLSQVLLSRLNMEILQRGTIPVEHRVPLTIILDEYSFIRSPIVPKLYRLSRNLTCTIIVMTQNLTVFDEDELRAITGNSNLLVMGCGQKEAERLCLELYKPTANKRKSWTEERYYSPQEEIYITQDYLSDNKQKEQQGVALIKPKGLYFMKTRTRPETPANPKREHIFRQEVAKYWYKKSS